MTSRPSRPLNPTRTNLWVDLALFAAMLLAPARAPATRPPERSEWGIAAGVAIHEWFSLALAAVLATAATYHHPALEGVRRTMNDLDQARGSRASRPDVHRAS
jgi:hypothetical protein